MSDNPTIEFALRMGDNCLILAQQVGAWCGHAPVVEEDIAFANVALDLIGQTKLWLGYAGELEGKGRSADDLAFLRDVRQFRNCLLVEQPNDEFAKALMRQFLFDAWHHPMLTALTKSSNARIAEIAEKSVKEVSYHLERSHDLITRLGDGSPESHAKMQHALNELWRYTGELMTPDSVDEALAADGAAPELSDIQAEYTAYMRSALEEATLVAPEKVHMYQGGKTGVHTEKLGHLVAEMQWMQRAYPGLKW